jgi:glycosyltransferase involved in cell wall biosynthesis
LVVFMTRGVSLLQWERQGIFEREVALLRGLRQRLAGLVLVTYGGHEERAFAGRLPGIDILPNRWRLPPRLYARLAPWLHAAPLAGATVLRTNQMKGVEAALAAKRHTGASLIVRCGYLWSLAAAQFKGGWRGQLNHAEALRAEGLGFAEADAVVLTTEAMKRHVATNYATPPSRIWVIPNYVLDGFFDQAPQAGPAKIVFVGRLEPDKNPAMVLEAARGLGVEVLFIGQGSLGAALARQAAQSGVTARFVACVPHLELPGYLAGSLFILPSPREGHPKTLIEAMAAGAAVIGSDAPGIREVIQPEITGLLAHDATGLREAAGRLLADSALRARLGRAAREFAREHYSFPRALAVETSLVAELSERRSSAG